jgi:hypothetical protein
MGFLWGKGRAPIGTRKEMQPMYGDKCLALRSVRWWCCELTNGRQDLNDNERSGLPRSSLTLGNTACVDAIVRADRLVHLKLVFKELDISYDNLTNIIHDSLVIARFHVGVCLSCLMT